MARRLSAEALAHLQRWEGLVLYAYDDADKSHPKRFIGSGDPVAGTLTIGYGHTRTVRLGQRITEAEAVRLFRDDLAPAEAAVDAIIYVPLTDNQFAALVSFAFNLGTSTERGAPLWNIAETLNQRDYAGAIRRMGLYNKQKVGGRLVTVPGLVNRRAVEAGLWAKGEFVSSASVPATAPAPAPSPAADASILGGATLAAPAVASVVSSFSTVPWPVALIIVCAALAAGAFYLLRRQRKAA